MAVKEAVTITYNSYVQNWNKFMTVNGDTAHYFHFTAGRTKYSEWWACPNAGKSETKVLSDKNTQYYYDNASIFSTGINNYKAQH